MAADSDGCKTITTVVTCEGNLSDPEFAQQFEVVVGKLNGILGEEVKIHKLEPWNSVRVTLSIPREAALRLRKLASEGSQQLRALGILSVQVEGDQVISLRIANSVNAEPQEILLQTTQDGSGSSRQESEGALSRFLSGPSAIASTSGSEPSEKIPFKSPNVVCPSDSVVPKVPVSAAGTNSSTPPTTKGYGGPFPFASMNQAIHSNRDTNYTAPPPPYPGNKTPNPTVTISSPLLVNLLQNDGAPQKTSQKCLEPSVSNSSAVKLTTNNAVIANRTVQQNTFVQKPLLMASSQQQQQQPVSQNGPGLRTIVANRTVPNALKPHNMGPRLLTNNHLESEVTFNTNNKSLNMQHPVPKLGSPISSQASSSSPSALSNTSIRQNSIPNSTISNMTTTIPIYPNQAVAGAGAAPTTIPQNNNLVPTRSLPPPPPYTVAVNRQWDSVVQTSPFLDLTPSLTDLKVDDLEDLLPSLERDLARSPLEIPEELTTRSEEKRNFLINPLTGELEPQSSGESEADELGDVFTGLPSPAALSDDDTNSTIRPDTTDQSDSETRSSHSDSGKHSRIKSKVRDRGRDSPGLKPTEKIKLRLKLEKTEPINSAYKVDVSFIQQPKKASTSVVSPGEELRVPPLHISLRGRHHYITKKKNKLNADGSPAKLKARKATDATTKLKKSLNDGSAITNSDDSINININNSLLPEQQDKSKIVLNDAKKVKKLKSNNEHASKELLAANSLLQENELISKLVKHNSTHYKEKQKERRGSDSELSRTNMKFVDNNGSISVEKKRRLSQSEPASESDRPTILGSTNVGTVTPLPQKIRKDKSKTKDAFKLKDAVRNKSVNNKIGEKFTKQVVLPTGEIDMEAKFKQRLMEGSEKGIPRPPHRTETIHPIVADTNQLEKADKVLKAESEPPPLKEKSPEPDKCNTPDRKQPDLGDKQAGRSPNSGAQGEDSGIESMDALSEKSPNQASQSPHADIPEPINKSKTQVSDMLDIEAQLAKMEGLNGVEDMNENKHSAPQTKLAQCCELTSALQDSLKQGSVNNANIAKEPQSDVNLGPVKSKTKEDDLEPLPVRVTPPLYTYSNPDKGRGSESPTMSYEEANNSCSNTHKGQSLLEQLLIEIPDNQTPSSPSPATRSVRTRALSKLSSPELNSPVSVKQTRSATPATTKRKRLESDSSSNNSLEDMRNKKPRKCSENAAELIKAYMGVDPAKNANNVNKKAATTTPTTGKTQEESSDSDEPLIEKVRKTANNTNSVAKAKVKPGNAKNVSVSTRRSVRTTAVPAPNTRSKGDKSQDKVHAESEAIRRKTRSTVSEGENKRKKEVK